MRIAVVEDNLVLADGIARAFRSDGHGVDEIHDGADAMAFLLQETVNLIVLDINLPGDSGLEILSSLRKNGIQTPVLLLTARDSMNDKVSGLDLGADDYLTKPFDLTELQARARALLRRSEKPVAQTQAFGEIEYNEEARQIKLNGKLLDLPRREFALAELLMQRSGHVISKNQIIENLYGAGAEIEDSAIELYIHRLRKKLVSDSVEIKTVRGLGYCFRVKS